MSSHYIFGRHAVRALLETEPKRVLNIYISPNVDGEFRPLAQRHGIKVETLQEKTLDRELDGAVHQGVVARVTLEGCMPSYGEFIEALTVTPHTALVLLNEVQDPHNVGAIIRSAAAFGVAGVLIPAHNQAPITGTVVKASAGTVFSVPIVAINNENQTILDLKKRGFWIYGLAGDGTNDVSGETFDAPAVFVVGSEGEGMRAKTREHCDILLRIPTHNAVESLNASVSAAIVLSHWSAQHREAIA